MTSACVMPHPPIEDAFVAANAGLCFRGADDWRRAEAAAVEVGPIIGKNLGTIIQFAKW